MLREVKQFVQRHIKTQLQPRPDQFLKSSNPQVPRLDSLKALPSHHNRSYSVCVPLLPAAIRHTASDVHLYGSLYSLLLSTFLWAAGQWVIPPSILPTCVHTRSPVGFSHWLHGHIVILWTRPAESQLLHSSGQTMGYRMQILNPAVGFTCSSHIQQKGSVPSWPLKPYLNV